MYTYGAHSYVVILCVCACVTLFTVAPLLLIGHAALDLEVGGGLTIQLAGWAGLSQGQVTVGATGFHLYTHTETQTHTHTHIRYRLQLLSG